VYFALHFIEAFTPFLENPLLSVEKDRGYAEMYQYLKLIWIITLLAYISLQKKSPLYMVWILLFTYLLFDDALHIHEFVGIYTAENLNLTPAFGLRLQDYGEMAVSATVGISLLFFGVLAYRRGSQDFKNISKDLILLMGILVFFGIVVDMAHIAVQLGWWVNFILGVIEDGGEMIAVTLMVWYVFMLSQRNEKSNAYLCDLVAIILAPKKSFPVNNPIELVRLNESGRNFDKDNTQISNL
jgi:hypothetical protein